MTENFKVQKCYKLLIEKARLKIKKKWKNLKKNELNGKQLDQVINKAVRNVFDSENFFSNYSFISEEEDFSEIKSPCMVLDPVDGTAAYEQGLSEYCLSMSLFEAFPNNQNSLPSSFHWIWNFCTDDEVILEGSHLSVKLEGQWDKIYSCLVSRTDFSKFQSLNFPVAPMSSIAWKLALLSQGKCSFVISLTPKSIWDICAGTYICEASGISLYNLAGAKIKLTTQVLIPGPMIWAKEQDISGILENLRGRKF
jgi:myo-inositol-1(or 4)-monophosphatase